MISTGLTCDSGTKFWLGWEWVLLEKPDAPSRARRGTSAVETASPARMSEPWRREPSSCASCAHPAAVRVPWSPRGPPRSRSRWDRWTRCRNRSGWAVSCCPAGRWVRRWSVLIWRGWCCPDSAVQDEVECWSAAGDGGLKEEGKEELNFKPFWAFRFV